jgi:hypothetical protein
MGHNMPTCCSMAQPGLSEWWLRLEGLQWHQNLVGVGIPGGMPNKEAEICGRILGLHGTLVAGITALFVRGDSPLIIEHITGVQRQRLIPASGLGSLPNVLIGHTP